MFNAPDACTSCRLENLIAEIENVKEKKRLRVMLHVETTSECLTYMYAFLLYSGWLLFYEVLPQIESHASQ